MVNINESKFDYNDLSDSDKDILFKNYTATYMGSTGGSFSRNDFDWRAGNWEFYGSLEGGVSGRRQRCGLIKLTASYGEVDPTNPKNLSKKGFVEMMDGIKELVQDNPNTGIWSIMDPKMCTALSIFSKRNFPNDPFTTMPKLISVLVIGKMVKQFSATGTALKVFKNPLDKNFGCVEVQTPSGPYIKQLIANQSYYNWIKSEIFKPLDSMSDVAKDLINSFPGGLKKLVMLLPGYNKSDDTLINKAEANKLSNLDDQSDENYPTDDDYQTNN